ncbi:MAG TPA: hypothetical protein VIG46_02890 [Candidatus Baltobacteraceae bacterium]
MSLELITTLSAVATFVVIAATAVAAMVQLRHMRAANQVSSLSTFLDDFEGPKYREAFDFVRTDLAKRLEDPAFRREIREGSLDRRRHPEITVCNLFEQWGLFVRIGAIDIRFMEALKVAGGFWDRLEPVVAISAERTGGVNIVFENFEYLAIQARKWFAEHPNGTFPAGTARLPLNDPWKDRDRTPLP